MFLEIIDFIKNLLFVSGSYSNMVFPEPLNDNGKLTEIKGMLDGDKEKRINIYN